MGGYTVVQFTPEVYQMHTATMERGRARDGRRDREDRREREWGWSDSTQFSGWEGQAHTDTLPR